MPIPACPTGFIPYGNRCIPNPGAFVPAQLVPQFYAYNADTGWWCKMSVETAKRKIAETLPERRNAQEYASWLSIVAQTATPAPSGSPLCVRSSAIGQQVSATQMTVDPLADLTPSGDGEGGTLLSNFFSGGATLGPAVTASAATTGGSGSGCATCAASGTICKPCALGWALIATGMLFSSWPIALAGVGVGVVTYLQKTAAAPATGSGSGSGSGSGGSNPTPTCNSGFIWSAAQNKCVAKQIVPNPNPGGLCWPECNHQIDGGRT
jgi:hypothetical protein